MKKKKKILLISTFVDVRFLCFESGEKWDARRNVEIQTIDSGISNFMVGKFDFETSDGYSPWSDGKNNNITIGWRSIDFLN